MDTNTVSTHSSKTKTVTPLMYKQVMEEVEDVTEQLTNSREKLWKAEDELREAAGTQKVLQSKLYQQQEMSKQDQHIITKLRESNAAAVQEERIIRESLADWEKVFEKCEIKMQDDVDEIEWLRAQRSIMLENNEGLQTSLDLLRQNYTQFQFEADAKSPTNVSEENIGATKQETKLRAELAQMKRELAAAQAKQQISDSNIKMMQSRVNTMHSESGKQRAFSRQQFELESLRLALKNVDCKTQVAQENAQELEDQRALSSLGCGWSDQFNPQFTHISSMGKIW
jgi:chromosome segregation ATPase